MKQLEFILLLGGTGSRMNISGNDNKHLVSVGDKTIVEHIKDKVDKYEKEVAPFYAKHVITNGLGLNEIMPILGEDYVYHYQSQPDGLINAAKRANPKYPFVLHLGDQFYEDDLSTLTSNYRDNTAHVTLKWSDRCRYHNTAITEDNYIKKFIEKPNLPEGANGYVSTGIYIFKPEVFGMIKDLPVNCKGETDLASLLNNIIHKDGYSAITSNGHKGYWYDVGTPEILKQVNDYVKNK